MTRLWVLIEFRRNLVLFHPSFNVSPLIRRTYITTLFFKFFCGFYGFRVRLIFKMLL